MPYAESKEISLDERLQLLDGVRRLIGTRRETAASDRAGWFRPDTSSPEAYERSLGPFRNEIINTLGWPLDGTSFMTPISDIRCEQIAEDEHGRIYRVRIPSIAPLSAYGLFFLPPASSGGSASRYPLVIAQHGACGTPELAAGFWRDEPTNYHGFITGLRERVRTTPVAIFAPQLLVWGDGQDPSFSHQQLDAELRHLGGSRAALDMRMLRDSLDWLTCHPEIDSARIGMTGLSYGGFYSLYFSAIDPRVRVVISSCYVNDSYRYGHNGRIWTGSAHRFLTGEVARMICPRPLFLEAGKNDPVFDVGGFPPVAGEAASAYASLGLADRFTARIHDGVHEYSPDCLAGEFLLKWL